MCLFPWLDRWTYWKVIGKVKKNRFLADSQNAPHSLTFPFPWNKVPVLVWLIVIRERPEEFQGNHIKLQLFRERGQRHGYYSFI